jgi:hypothetical protein
VAVEEIVAFVAVGLFSLAFIALGIALFKGRGASLIAGYNSMSSDEQAEYDRIALCKFIGKVFLAVGLSLPILPIGQVLGFSWLITAWGVLFFGLVLFVLIYVNTGNRFRK